MADVTEIKQYLTKLQKVVTYEADFKFFDTELIKKSKIDDILCCLIASLPNTFKNRLRDYTEKKYPSIITFRTLNKKLGVRYFLNPKLCMLNVNECKRLIGAILTTIEKDIQIMEKLENS